MMGTYVLLVLGMIVAFAGQILLKTGVAVSGLSPSIKSILITLASPRVFVGFVLYGFSAIVWLFVLQKLPLSVAAPTLTLNYVFIFLYSMYFLGERVIPLNFLGMLLIMLGVILITLK